MSRSISNGIVRGLLAVAALTTLGSGAAADLNPKALIYKLPGQIKWVASPSGASTAVLVGDPDKPGMYVLLNKWSPHHMSRPHFHPNDRFITVLSGTWWVGTGPKYDPDSTVPMPAGSFVKTDSLRRRQRRRVHPRNCGSGPRHLHARGTKVASRVSEMICKGVSAEVRI